MKDSKCKDHISTCIRSEVSSKLRGMCEGICGLPPPQLHGYPCPGVTGDGSELGLDNGERFNKDGSNGGTLSTYIKWDSIIFKLSHWRKQLGLYYSQRCNNCTNNRTEIDDLNREWEKKKVLKSYHIWLIAWKQLLKVTLAHFVLLIKGRLITAPRGREPSTWAIGSLWSCPIDTNDNTPPLMTMSDWTTSMVRFLIFHIVAAQDTISDTAYATNCTSLTSLITKGWRNMYILWVRTKWRAFITISSSWREKYDIKIIENLRHVKIFSCNQQACMNCVCILVLPESACYMVIKLYYGISYQGIEPKKNDNYSL